MQSLTFDALVPFGWTDRVLALFHSVVETDPEPGAAGDLTPARITRVERSACVAVGVDGVQRPLRARPLPVVGDWVACADGAVRHVLPRWSQLTRADPGGAVVQVLAADLDLVAVVTPADRCSPARVEREVAIAWDSGAVPVVILTKADLAAPELAGELTARLSGVELIVVSVVTGEGVAAVRHQLAPDRTAVLLGPSGAGKSTLANALVGDERLATGAVRDGDARGRHTTTSRQLLAVPGGGVLIDTPGLRSLGLAGDVDLATGFPDVETLAAGCRFGDCAHDGEPGCEVDAALRDGRLDPERLASFRKLAREAAAQRRRTDPLVAREQRRVWAAWARNARAHDKRR